MNITRFDLPAGPCDHARMFKTYNACRSCAGSLALALVVTGCAKSGHSNLNSTLWALTSAEYEAATQTIYESAKQQLAQAKADTTWTAALEQTQDLNDPSVSAGLIPAVILDIDETVLNNARYQAQLIRDNRTHDRDLWDDWVAERRAPVLEGVIEFIREAKRQSIAVIYLTNRACRKRSGSDAPCPQRTDTIVNLQEAGLPPLGPDDLVLLRNQQPGWSRDKSTRRAFVCENYRILQIFGDNLGDFAPGNGGPGATHHERRAAIARYQDKWGSKWFMLPNPMYGGWIMVLDQDLRSYVE